MSKKTVHRINVALRLLQETADTDSAQENREALTQMLRSIRMDPDHWEQAEADPVKHMGRYINELALSGSALDVCVLVKKLRAVDTADLSTIHAFYAGMIEHFKGLKRLCADLPAEATSPKGLNCTNSPYMYQWIKESEAKLRFLELLEEETRAKVSVCAAEDLMQYVRLLRAQVEFVVRLHKK